MDKNIKKIVFFFLIILVGCKMNIENKQEDQKYEWYASGNAPSLYPTELFFGDFIFTNGERLYIPESIPFASTWGSEGKTHLLNNNNIFPAPNSIDIIWLSLAENQFYSLEATLPKKLIDNLLAEIDENTNDPKYDGIVVGMAPYGGLAVWLSGIGITTEVVWLQAEATDVVMKDFSPDSRLSQNEYVEFLLKECDKAYENFQKNGLPDRMLFERYMQKFNYNITTKFEEENANFEAIELFYYNGELNTTNSGEHELLTMRAKPSKIVIHWNIGKTKYSGYFWTDENKIIKTFSDFYENNMQKEGSFVIEIEESNKNFKFSMQNDTVITEIPIGEIQFIIFKNKFEFYRSPNYDKPQGGWRN
jgi:hypothetical protein